MCRTAVDLIRVSPRMAALTEPASDDRVKPGHDDEGRSTLQEKHPPIEFAIVALDYRGSSPRVTRRSNAGSTTPLYPAARMTTFADIFRGDDVSILRRDGSHVETRVKPAHDGRRS